MKRKNILFSIVIISIMNMPLVAMQERNAFVTKAQKVWKTFKKDMRCASKWNCTPEQRNRLIKQGLALAAIVGTLIVGIGWFGQRYRKQSEDVRQSESGRAGYMDLLSKTASNRRQKLGVVAKFSPGGMEGPVRQHETIRQYEHNLGLAAAGANQGNYAEAIQYLNVAIRMLDEAYVRVPAAFRERSGK